MRPESFEVFSKRLFSNHIDLKLFFEDITDYVIIKLSENFPNYYDYEDIDIVCNDADKFYSHILAVGQQYINKGFEIKTHHENNHFHVDVYSPGAKRLNVRFDLLSSLDVYRKIAVDPQYHQVVLASKQETVQNGTKVFVPSIEHELAIRLLEYFEWKDEMPSKIKHLNFINKNNNLSFIAIVNKYTNLNIAADEQQRSEFKLCYKSEIDAFPKPDSMHGFYQLDTTCQIPGLSKVYEDYFGKRTDGYFVEFGAYDGEYVSNTSGLADIGWNGYYIEPVPEYYKQCKLRHSKNKNITVSQGAIGSDARTVTINIAGPLSTISDSMKDHFRTLDWAKDIFNESTKICVQQITLSDYLLKHNIAPNFELLVVDVEGQEWDVFRNFDIDKWRPQMVIIELQDQNDDYMLIREQCLQLIDYFERHGYEPLYKDPTNTIYVSRLGREKEKQRMDYFMIWGHGLQYTDQIMNIIRSRHDLEIITIVRKSIDDITQFIQDVYACDTVPFHHLIEKTRYLLTTKPEIIFILTKNKNPQEMYFGEGVFRHIQSQLVKNIKEEIRNKFNPRRGDVRTENHVIHASDYESQVEHVLQVLGLPTLKYYKREPHHDLEVPYHLDKFETYEIIAVCAESLYANILERGLLGIKDTPHYRYVAGEKSDYLDYHQKHFGSQLTDDHFPEAFDKMINNFCYNGNKSSGKQSLIVAKKLSEDKYQILDGVHRAAILTYKHLEKIRIALVAPEDKDVMSVTESIQYSPQLSSHEEVQDAVARYSQLWLQNNFYEQHEIIKQSIDMFMCSGTLSIGRQQTLGEFFRGSADLWQQFITPVIDKNCLEVGSGPCGLSNYWHFIRKWHVIDPLVDKYKQMTLDMFGKTWWWHWINTHSQGAEKLIPALIGRIDGVIVCRNALGHVEYPIEVLNNIGLYAAPGCKLLLWTDLYHINERDVGHKDICRSRELFKMMITNRGFLIEYETPPFRQGETIEFGCVAVKMKEHL